MSTAARRMLSRVEAPLARRAAGLAERTVAAFAILDRVLVPWDFIALPELYQRGNLNAKIIIARTFVFM
jgi:aromatic ring hydroxylase